MHDQRVNQTVPPLPEALAVVAICFGWFILNSFAVFSSNFTSGVSFNDAPLVQLVLVECVLGTIALTLLSSRGYVLRELLPTPSWRGCAIGLVLLVVADMIWFLVYQTFPANQYAQEPIARMMAESKPSLAVLLLMSMVNGLYEETFLVGYLVRGFRAYGASFALGLSLLVRISYHVYQGPIGVVSVLVFGLTVSGFYWRTHRLWPVVVAHMLADLSAFTL